MINVFKNRMCMGNEPFILYVLPSIMFKLEILLTCLRTIKGWKHIWFLWLICSIKYYLWYDYTFFVHVGYGTCLRTIKGWKHIWFLWLICSMKYYVWYVFNLFYEILKVEKMFLMWSTYFKTCDSSNFTNYYSQ